MTSYKDRRFVLTALQNLTAWDGDYAILGAIEKRGLSEFNSVLTCHQVQQ